MIAILAEHGTSRAGDSHPHGHLVILNCVQRQDSTYSTLENYELMKAQNSIQQDIYNGIAKGAKKLGYVVDVTKTNSYVQPELRGIDKETRDLFSKRHNEIQNADALIAELRERMPNASDIKIDNIAQLMTKTAKDPNVTEKDIVNSHHAQAEAMGKDLPAIVAKASTLGNSEERTQPRTAPEYLTISLTANVEQESVVRRETIVNDAVKIGCGDIVREDVEKAFDAALKSGEIKQLGSEKSNAYSTPAMIKAEKDIAVAAVTQATQFTPLMSRDGAAEAIKAFEAGKVAEGINGFSVSRGQRDSITQVLSENQGQRLSVIAGDAGAGKSSAFACINDALKNMPGIEVRGFGFQGKASASLESSSGISSTTLHSFLGQKTGEDNGNRKLWIVDEASMVGSRQLDDLVKKSELQNAQIILVGDSKQLSSISSGDMFKKIQQLNLTPTVRMSEIQRQKYYNEQGKQLRPGRDDMNKCVNAYAVEMAQDLKRSDFTAAFNKLDGAGQIKEFAGRQERINYTAEKFVSYGTQKDAIVLTATNRDRKDAIAVIRPLQKAAGQIGEKDSTYTTRDPISVSGIYRSLASSYAEGNYVTLGKAVAISKEVTLASGTVLRISGTDNSTNQLKFDLNDKNNEVKIVGKNVDALGMLKAEGKENAIDLKQHGSSLQQFAKVETTYSLKEAIMITKNNNTVEGKLNGEKNGVRIILQSIDEKTGLATVVTESEKKINNYNLQDSYTTQGQVISINKSQGISCKHVINMVSAGEVGNLIHSKSAYVALTRHEQSVEVVTDSKADLLEAVSRQIDKTSTLDFMPAAEMAELQARAAESREATREPSELQKIEAQIDAKELAEQKELVQSHAQPNCPTEVNDKTQTVQPDHEAGNIADRSADQNLTGSNNDASHVETDHGKKTETSVHETGKTADHPKDGDRGDDKSGGGTDRGHGSGSNQDCSSSGDNDRDANREEPEQEREQEHSR
jgi:ATP-dependent exoDNAse (exonuclease V) alpha subunit